MADHPACCVDYQCGRCGSSIAFEDCATCEACMIPRGEGEPGCPTCRGTGTMSTCLATFEWCENHPLPGHEHIERHRAEEFFLPCAHHAGVTA